MRRGKVCGKKGGQRRRKFESRGRLAHRDPNQEDVRSMEGSRGEYETERSEDDRGWDVKAEAGEERVSALEALVVEERGRRVAYGMM